MSYKSTREEFMTRLVAIIPPVLAESTIADEIAELYPELHVPFYADLVCAADTHAEIIDAVRTLSDDDLVAIVTLPMSDAIMQLEELTQSDADDIMTLVRRVDPTDSNIAAEIRDTIRDTFDNVTL